MSTLQKKANKGVSETEAQILSQVSMLLSTLGSKGRIKVMKTLNALFLPNLPAKPVIVQAAPVVKETKPKEQKVNDDLVKVAAVLSGDIFSFSKELENTPQSELKQLRTLAGKLRGHLRKEGPYRKHFKGTVDDFDLRIEMIRNRLDESKLSENEKWMIRDPKSKDEETEKKEFEPKPKGSKRASN
jgi:hypothetical protein